MLAPREAPRRPAASGADGATQGRTGPRGRAPALLGVALGLAACTRPLPDADSPGARAYERECTSGCHAVYAPGSMTPAMWEYQVSRMDELRQLRGLPRLGAHDRKLILDYLLAHAG